MIFPGIRPHLMTLNMFSKFLLVRDYIMLRGKSSNHWIAQVYEGWRHEGVLGRAANNQGTFSKSMYIRKGG